MKRIKLIIITLVLTVNLFASRGMSIIPLSSPLYQYMDVLYTLEGHAASEGARPWTKADFMQQINRITPTSEVAKNLYELILGSLNNDGEDVYVDWNLIIQPSVSAHSNENEFSFSSYAAKDVLNSKLLKFNAGLYVYDYFAGNFGFSLGFANSTNITGGENGLTMNRDDRFSSNFSTNIPFISEGTIEIDFTDNSFISVGTPYISIALGRGKLSWGNGEMGNLILGNTLPYHDYINISASNNTWFDFDMVVSFFTHSENYAYMDFTKELKGIQMFIAHRFEFRMFSDKLRLSLNEAIMYQTEETSFDFRILNPLLIMHGFYIPSNANSLASLELEYAPIKNLQLYASFVVDDMAVGEAKAPENDATLNMWGIMGGIRGTLPYRKGYFSFLWESVYTSPFMYHKGSYNDNADYSLDFVASLRFFKNNQNIFYRQYLSFPFGSDAIAIKITTSYTVPLKWEVGLNLFFMAHGITNVNTINGRYDNNSSDYVPGALATENPFTLEKGNISYTYDAGIHGEYHILRNLKLETSLDFIYIANYENGNTNVFDVQWTFGLKYSIF